MADYIKITKACNGYILEDFRFLSHSTEVMVTTQGLFQRLLEILEHRYTAGGGDHYGQVIIDRVDPDTLTESEK